MAVAALDEATRRFQEGDSGFWLCMMKAVASYVARANQDIPGALRLANEGLALIRPFGDLRREAALLVNTAELLSQLECWDEARGRFETAVEIYRLVSPGLLAVATRNLGLCLIELNDLDGALEALEQALAAADGLEEAPTRVSLALLELHRGDPDRAQTHLDQARESMEGWFGSTAMLEVATAWAAHLRGSRQAAAAAIARAELALDPGALPADRRRVRNVRRLIAGEPTA